MTKPLRATEPHLRVVGGGERLPPGASGGDRDQELAGGGPRRDAKMVLIAEDHPDTRTIFRMALSHRGYRVVEAVDGTSALEVAARYVPRLILLDLDLPTMNGWDVAAALRADAATVAIPILLTSGHTFPPAARRRAAALRLAGYLDKPISPSVLVREVERLIGPPDP